MLALLLALLSHLRLQTIKKRAWENSLYDLVFKSRGDRIRTCDLVLPKHWALFLIKYFVIWSFIDDCYELRSYERGVAQLGSAGALGALGRRFESCRPDS